ncbi:MAG: hypothetical protein V2I62_03900, partial [Bacteroidales bacterium]|nr:hypothetical protein [Bacteroidales bacterium]
LITAAILTGSATESKVGTLDGYIAIILSAAPGTISLYCCKVCGAGIGPWWSSLWTCIACCGLLWFWTF